MVITVHSEALCDIILLCAGRWGRTRLRMGSRVVFEKLSGEFCHEFAEIHSAIKNRGIEAWAAESVDIRRRYFWSTTEFGFV
jgi:hypothetical protein